MTDLRSVMFPEEFRAGARNAVTTCLRIQPSEKVTLITDEATREIAAAIATELENIGCRWNGFVLEELAQRPLKDMPRAGARRHGELRGVDLRGAGAAE